MDRRVFMLATASSLLSTPSLAAGPTLVPIAKGLDHPWGLAFLPDGSALITERVGRLRHYDLKTGKMSDTIAGTPEVDASGQGGLLGIALDPDFTTTRQVFLSFALSKDGGSATAVFRARLAEDNAMLLDGKTIFSQSEAKDSGRHFGSRLVFDRDKNLFVTTGDRGNASDSAQDPASHIGKILRITRDGAPAPGNPMLAGWASEVWSLGHRNAQGATLHPTTGQLWTVEHGARGGDEINTPQAGKNYGWPVITFGKDYSGDKIGIGTSNAGMEQPLHYWDPSIAPSGMAFITSNLYPTWKGSLLVGALAGAHIVRLTLDGTKITSEERLFDGFARFRDVVQGPDGRIYALTDEPAPDGGLFVIAAEGDVTSGTNQ